MFRKNWKEFSGRADSAMRGRHSQTLVSSSVFAPNCLLPSLLMLVPPNHHPLPFSPFGSGSEYPRTGFMHLPKHSSLTSHQPLSPQATKFMRWPRGLPGGTSPQIAQERDRARGFSFKSSSSVLGLPLLLCAYKRRALIPNPTFTIVESRWAAPSPLFTRSFPAVIQLLLGGQHSPCRRLVDTAGSEGLLMRLAPPARWASQPHTSGEELLHHSSPQQRQLHLHELPLFSGLLSICGAELLTA